MRAERGCGGGENDLQSGVNVFVELAYAQEEYKLRLLLV